MKSERSVSLLGLSFFSRGQQLRGLGEPSLLLDLFEMSRMVLIIVPRRETFSRHMRAVASKRSVERTRGLARCPNVLRTERHEQDLCVRIHLISPAPLCPPSDGHRVTTLKYVLIIVQS